MPFTQPWLEVNFGTAYAGLVGTVGYRLYQSNDADSIARTTAGIVEIGTNTGCYGVVPPSIPDNAVGIEWDTGGGSPVSATEDLEPYRRRALIEGKLPTNYIMGSSDQADHDGEIGDILADTADMQPKLGTPAGADMSADIAAIQADTDDIQTRLPAALVGGRMDSDVGNMQADTVDANALATDAAQEIRDEILADSTPFNGADIDQSLSTTESNIRGADGDDLKDISDQIDGVQADTNDIQTRLPAALVGGRMDSDVGNMQAGVVDASAVATDAIDADALATDAVDEIVDAVWNEDIVAAHGTGDTAGLLLRALGALISQRANTPTLHGLLGVADSAGVDLPEQINTELEVTQGHGAGSWQSATIAPSAVAAAVWDEDIVAAHGGADTAGLLLRALGALISQRANNPTLNALLGVADAAGSDLEGNVRGADSRDLSELAGGGFSSATDTLEVLRDRIDQISVAAQTTASAGSTATEIRTGLTQADDFFNNMQVVAINAAGVAVRNINDFTNTNGAIIVDALPFTPTIGDTVLILARTGSVPIDVAAIADGVWDEDVVAAHGTGDTAGLLLRALGAVISQRANNPTLDAVLGVVDAAGRDLPEQVDIELTATHGAGAWTTAAGAVDWTAAEREQIRDALGVDGTKTTAVGGQLQKLHIAATATIAAGSTATQVRTNLTEADGFWNNMVMVVEDASGGGQRVARNIDNYTNTNGALYTFEGLPFTPSAGDPVYIIARTGSLRDDRSPMTL